MAEGLVEEFLGDALVGAFRKLSRALADTSEETLRWLRQAAEPPPNVRLVSPDGTTFTGVVVVKQRSDVIVMLAARHPPRRQRRRRSADAAADRPLTPRGPRPEHPRGTPGPARPDRGPRGVSASIPGPRDGGHGPGVRGEVPLAGAEGRSPCSGGVGAEPPHLLPQQT